MALLIETKQWKCPNGHVLGVVERAKEVNNGRYRHVTRLILYRHAIDLSQAQPEDVDVIGALEGTMLRIRCDVPGCGAVRTWQIGEEAIERLIELFAPKEKEVKA
jgi:hypothetical protein